MIENLYDEEFLKYFKIVWNYMRIDMTFEKCDLIIGCGCMNTNIPIRCSELLKNGYGKKILFCGGLGKVSKDILNKTEAETFRDIAIDEGVSSRDIFIENRSTNTEDNFRFAKEVIQSKNLDADRILIVHNTLSERRTLSTARAILKNKKLFITSPNVTFEEFIEYLKNNEEKINDSISCTVGDIQRLIIYPQFGWQVKEIVPGKVLDAYYYLKNNGYTKFIISKRDIQNLIDKNGIIDDMEPNYFN